MHGINDPKGHKIRATMIDEVRFAEQNSRCRRVLTIVAAGKRFNMQSYLIVHEVLNNLIPHYRQIEYFIRE